MNMAVEMNLENNLSSPLAVIPCIIFIINLLNAIDILSIIDGYYTGGIDGNTYGLKPIIYITQDLTQVTNDISIGILALNETLDVFNLDYSITRYENLVDLHRNLEDAYDCLQRMISILEEVAPELDGTNRYDRALIRQITNLTLEVENLRGAGNLLVTAIRSLEHNIHVLNPVYQFIAQLWFES